MFHGWARFLPPGIEACSVLLPGRERRIQEAPYCALEPLEDAFLRPMSKLLDLPFAIFGHSMGALLGFQFARRLRRERLPAPFHLIVSGARAPHLPDPKPPIHGLPDEELVAELRRLQGTPEELLSDDELMLLYLPVLRADFKLCDTYTYLEEQPLESPITAFGGQSDSEVSVPELEAWKEHTRSRFSLRMFPGDHFFVHKSRPLVLAALSDLL
jgi:medium-chain acyl-[acyl-carrier-protein] hydrolase